MFGFFLTVAGGFLAIQFALVFVANLTTSERDNAFLPKIYAAVRWVTTANARAAAAAGQWVRARWDAWRARRAG